MDCLREVELNRRLAPGVYLGVAAIEITPGGFEPLRTEEGLAAESVDTSDPAWREALLRRAAGWIGS